MHKTIYTKALFGYQGFLAERHKEVTRDSIKNDTLVDEWIMHWTSVQKTQEFNSQVKLIVGLDLVDFLLFFVCVFVLF